MEIQRWDLSFCEKSEKQNYHSAFVLQQAVAQAVCILNSRVALPGSFPRKYTHLLSTKPPELWEEARRARIQCSPCYFSLCNYWQCHWLGDLHVLPGLHSAVVSLAELFTSTSSKSTSSKVGMTTRTLKEWGRVQRHMKIKELGRSEGL